MAETLIKLSQNSQGSLKTENKTIEAGNTPQTDYNQTLCPVGFTSWLT
jgi:hypothetical protein